MTRQSSFTQELADAICNRLTEGESLRSICNDDSMPAMSSVMRWLSDSVNVAFREQYAHAREMQADVLADEIIAIADDGTRDTVIDGDGVAKTDHDVIARSRLRVDARKWYAGKLRPKKYGDSQSIELGSDPDKPMITKLVRQIVRPTNQDG